MTTCSVRPPPPPQSDSPSSLCSSSSPSLNKNPWHDVLIGHIVFEHHSCFRSSFLFHAPGRSCDAKHISSDGFRLFHRPTVDGGNTPMKGSSEPTQAGKMFASKQTGTKTKLAFANVFEELWESHILHFKPIQLKRKKLSRAITQFSLFSTWRFKGWIQSRVCGNK